MAQFIIRPARPEDANLLADVHVDSIRTLGALAYSAEIVAEWGAPRTGERYLKGMESGQFWFLAAQTISDGSEQALRFSVYSAKAGQHRIAVYVRGEAARKGLAPRSFSRRRRQRKNAELRKYTSTHLSVRFRSTRRLALKSSVQGSISYRPADGCRRFSCASAFRRSESGKNEVIGVSSVGNLVPRFPLPLTRGPVT